MRSLPSLVLRLIGSLIVLLLVGFLIALTPLSYAELPDQAWLSGLYDGSDDDDVIAPAQVHLCAIKALSLHTITVVVLSIPAPAPLYERVPPAPVRSSSLTRAPPAS